MQHVVSLSGGLSSAVCAERVMDRFGKDAVTLWFADTSWEDEDLYRFLIDLEAYWDKEIVRFKDGRTPLQVAEQRSLIPNSGKAPCSYELKIRPFTTFLNEATKPVTVYIGLDWSEQHRLAAPKRAYEAISGVTVEFPLLWKPYETRKYTDVVRAWGLDPPRAYALSMSHNNCAFRCVRQGIKEWQRLYYQFPERFEEMAVWEEQQRAKGGARAGRAFLVDRTAGQKRPMTLRELEQRFYRDLEFVLEPEETNDASCYCTFADSDGNTTG